MAQLYTHPKVGAGTNLEMLSPAPDIISSGSSIIYRFLDPLKSVGHVIT